MVKAFRFATGGFYFSSQRKYITFIPVTFVF